MDRFVVRKVQASSSKTPEYVDVNTLPRDPGERKPISSYNPNQRDDIRRYYLAKGPFQPKLQTFKQTIIGGESRRFQASWYDTYKNWLEYSEAKDRAYCLCCYLFKDYYGNHKDAFVDEGFNSWNKKARFGRHVGQVNSIHNNSYKKCEDLVRKNQSIQSVFVKQSDKQKHEYRLRLSASIEVAKTLLSQGLPFRGHDESSDSLNKGNFLEILELLGRQSEELGNVILGNAPGNSKMTSPTIQLDIKHCFGEEVLKQIFEDLGDDVFSLLVDESSDVSKKEQMAVVIRYVDKYGIVKERFIGLVHVTDTSALSLKSAIDDLFSRYGLSLSKLRGQGYDGASNMAGEFNGLRALILKENPSAFYVHCFAHQLQLVVVAVAKKHGGVLRFFNTVACLTNVICASCKRQDKLRESQKNKLEEKKKNLEIEFSTGTGLNQELSLTRAGDTRWNSHYKTVSRLATLYDSIIEVLEYVEETSSNSTIITQAGGLIEDLRRYDFVFYMHLLTHLLDSTNNLSQSLQRKDQDLLNAMSLVTSTKHGLEDFRLESFPSFLETVNSFCDTHNVQMVNMDDVYINLRNPRKKTNMTCRHYYEYDCFNTVVDMQIQEFGNRFNEVTSELFTCMACLSPCDNFASFDIPKIIRLAEMYPCDFDEEDRRRLKVELTIYIDNLKGDIRFDNLDGLSSLARLMVETKKHHSFMLVYRLLKLTLVLPVATSSVERCFSGMKIVKSDLRNRIGDENLNDSCICYIEKELLKNVTTDDMIDRFQKMKTRREQV
ncbi:hypothetical protein SSX86_004238 [Deinandra increscens subsp. villosa]|uniref:TTF-type domain-containing protein n=1 Tax=Deinandra increscens subsp. villosa TaxID=3103831 RepID=A0AAP0DRR6_9ASTR